MKTTLYIEKVTNGFIVTLKNGKGKAIARTEEETAREIAKLFESSLHGIDSKTRLVFEIESRKEPCTN